MKNIGKCVFIIIGAIIGAGFASGQEIATFFNRFGEKQGFYGALIASLLFGIIVTSVLIIMDKKNIDKYEDMICNNKLLKIIIETFLFICFCIMISAIGAFFEQQLGISYLIGASLGAIICYLIFTARYKGLEVFNVVLAPVIIIGILIIGFRKL